MLGVISETAGVILGESSFHWSGRYVKNEFGGYVYEEQKDAKPYGHGAKGKSGLSMKKTTLQEKRETSGTLSDSSTRYMSDAMRL